MEEQLISAESSEQVSKILHKTRDLFLSIGIRSVTLDDIARELGMSKKTIYTYFDNKGVLVYNTVQGDLKEKQEIVQAVIDHNYDPITELLYIGKEVVASLQTFSVNIISDLMKFYPESWQLIEQHKMSFVYTVMLKNHQRGKVLGIYRHNMNEEITTKLFIGFTDSIINPQGLLRTGMSIADIYREHLISHLYSICTDTGRQQLEKLLTKIQLS